MLSETLPVITTELIIGVKVHADARSRRGHFTPLTATEKLRRNEMLLAGHAATGLASIGRVAVAAAQGEYLLSLRHLNTAALARLGWAALRVELEYRRRQNARAVPTWDELIRLQALPWELAELAVLRVPGSDRPRPSDRAGTR